MTTPLPRLMVAPNGARRGKADHPELPITLDETIQTALACQKAGAEGIHLHIRDKDGKHSLDVGQYREAIAALEQAAPDMFVQITSESAGIYDADTQRAMVRQLRPASVSVALREMLRSDADTQVAQEFYVWAAEEGVGIQHIVYSPNELQWLLTSIAQGVIPGTHHQLQMVLGSYTGAKMPEPLDLDAYLELLQPLQGAQTFDWMLCAFGAAETPCLAYAIACGGKARVGFENSLWNADGSLAKDNAERVAELRPALSATGQTLSPWDR